MKNFWMPVVCLGLAAAPQPAAYAGHEAPLYPSYYPQEIRIERVEPAAAARLLESGKMQAYVGRELAFAGATPKSIRFVASLGAYVVLRVNPASSLARDDRAACAMAGDALRALAAGGQHFVFHPYPINGFHADYLHHADRTEAAKRRVLEARTGAAKPRLRVQGALAEQLAPRDMAAASGADWDFSVESLEAGSLVAAQAIGLNGWIGPPWVKAGWFHAFLLLAPGLDDTARNRAAAELSRLQTGAFSGAADRINLERDFVSGLMAGCRTTIAGYTVKREHYSAEYSDGIENVAHDSHGGLNSAIFLRTAKLKDFPWNGWLTLGVPSSAAAAWNPFGGFTDDAGRLMWWAVGDPALFPEPHGAGWVMNRFGDVLSAPGK